MGVISGSNEKTNSTDSAPGINPAGQLVSANI